MTRRTITTEEINKCLRGKEVTRNGLQPEQKVVCVSNFPSEKQDVIQYGEVASVIDTDITVLGQPNAVALQREDGKNITVETQHLRLYQPD